MRPTPAADFTAAGHVVLAHEDTPGGRRADAAERFGQFALPVSAHTGDAEDLAVTHGQVDVLERGHVLVVHSVQADHLQSRGAGLHR